MSAHSILPSGNYDTLSRNRYLIDKGGDPLCVNIDLEFPVDICEQLWSDEEASSSSRFKLKEIKKILLTAIGGMLLLLLLLLFTSSAPDNDVDYVRDREQREMLRDCQELLDNPDMEIPICSDSELSDQLIELSLIFFLRFDPVTRGC